MIESIIIIVLGLLVCMFAGKLLTLHASFFLYKESFHIWFAYSLDQALSVNISMDLFMSNSG